MKICSISGCAGKVLARGFCSKHYQKLVIKGQIPTDSSRGRPRVLSAEQRAANKKRTQQRRDKGRYARMTDEQRKRHDDANRRYRATVPEKASQWQRKASKNYRKNHPMTSEQKERLSAYMKIWNQKNGNTPERVAAAREVSARWYKENKDRRDEKRKEWAKANPDAYRIYAQNRRARKRQQAGQISVDIVDRLFEMQNGKCAACRVIFGNNIELDHIVSLKSGGAHEDGNLQLLCRPCNRAKGARDPIEFMRSRGFLL